MADRNGVPADSLELFAARISAAVCMNRRTSETYARNFSHSSLPQEELTESSLRPSNRTVG